MTKVVIVIAHTLPVRSGGEIWVPKALAVAAVSLILVAVSAYAM